MEIEEFVEIYEKDGIKGIMGCFVLVDQNRRVDKNSMVGIAIDDSNDKKVKITL